MASDISNGPTRAKSIWVAPRRVAAGRTRARVRSRLAFALCLLLAAALGVAGVSACGGSSTESVSPAAVVSGTPVALATSAAVQEFRGMLPYVCTSSLIKERSYAKHEDGRRRRADAPRRLDVPARQLRPAPDRHGRGRHQLRSAAERHERDHVGHEPAAQRRRDLGASAGRAASPPAATCITSTAPSRGPVATPASSLTGAAGFAESGEGFTSDIEIVGAGWIETTDGSPVPPAPGPGTTPANWTPVVGIATMKCRPPTTPGAPGSSISSSRTRV